MKTADAPPTAATDKSFPLVFEWERRKHARWRLAGLIALSLLVHAIGFYVFQVAYTPTGSQSAPSVQVTMLPVPRGDASSETGAQARALARSLAIDDPSLAVEPKFQESDPGRDDSARYVPSYKAAPPPFKPLDPPVAGSAAPPRPDPPGPVPIPLVGAVASAATPAPPTRVTLTGGLVLSAPRTLPPVSFAVSSGAKILGTTTFLVGVNAGGSAPFVFRENSSGDVAADDFAQEYLARLSIRPAATVEDGATVWGWAEFHWGRDVYRESRLP